MENSLLIRQFWNLIVEVSQKIFQVIIVGHEKPKILIGLFESNCGNNFQILNISVDRLKQGSLVRIQNVVSLFSSDDLTD